MRGYSIKEAFTDTIKEEHYGFIKSFLRNIKKNIKGPNKMKKMQKRLAHMPVIVYNNCNYKAGRIILKVGNYPSIPNFNDKISSVRVMPGFKVTFYEHGNYGGKYITLTKNSSCLVNQNWNDIISSAKVQKLNITQNDTIKTTGVRVSSRNVQKVNVGKVSSKIGNDKTVKEVKINNKIKMNQKLKGLKMPKTSKIFEDFTIESDYFSNCSMIIVIILIAVLYYLFYKE